MQLRKTMALSWRIRRVSPNFNLAITLVVYVIKTVLQIRNHTTLNPNWLRICDCISNPYKINYQEEMGCFIVHLLWLQIHGSICWKRPKTDTPGVTDMKCHYKTASNTQVTKWPTTVVLPAERLIILIFNS